MANREHVQHLARGVSEWNHWRDTHPEIQPDLSGTMLREAQLSEANLREADLRQTNLSKADLSQADLSQANLHGAKLRGAWLYAAILYGALLVQKHETSSDSLVPLRTFRSRYDNDGKQMFTCCSPP